MLEDLKIDNIYKFNTLAPAVLGASYTDMKFLGKVSSKVAKRSRDIATLHNNLLSTIANLPLSVHDLNFLIFESADGEEIVLAAEYIDTYTLIPTETTNIRIEIYNVTDVDLSNLKLRLAEIGYTKANITTFEL